MIEVPAVKLLFMMLLSFYGAFRIGGDLANAWHWFTRRRRGPRIVHGYQPNPGSHDRAKHPPRVP